MRVLFVIEEGNDDVNITSEARFNGGMSPITECFKKGREFGIGVCISLSSLRTVPPLIRENATTQLVFQPGDSTATIEAARTLMLSPEQTATLGHLQPGECLMRQIGPWPHAIKGKIDYIAPSRVHVDRYDTHPYIEVLPLQKIPAIVAFIKQHRRTDSSHTPVESKQEQNPIEKTAHQLIELAAKHPYIPVTRLFDKTDVHHHKEQAEVRDLVKLHEWAEFEETRIGRSNMFLIEVTSAGYQTVGVPEPQGNKGRGGITHRHYSHWIRLKHQQKGRKAWVEWIPPGSDHPVDVAVQYECGYDVYEVCVTAKDNLLSHIEKVFQSNTIQRLIFVAGTKIQLRALKKDLNQNMLFIQHATQITFETIEDYVPRSIDENH